MWKCWYENCISILSLEGATATLQDSIMSHIKEYEQATYDRFTLTSLFLSIFDMIREAPHT